MKFSHGLQFNAVQEWSQHYIAYATLKKLIYQIERDILQAEEEGLGDHAPLLNSAARANSVFIPALDRELEKIVVFYNAREGEFRAELDHLEHDMKEAGFLVAGENISRSMLLASPRSRASVLLDGSRLLYDEPSADGDTVLADSIGMEDSLHSNPLYNSIAHLSNSQSHDLQPRVDSPTHITVADVRMRLDFIRRTRDLYVRLCELRSYAQLNYTGFAKILKKYDKITRNRATSVYMNDVVRKAWPFTEHAREQLQECIVGVSSMHAAAAGISDAQTNARELRRHLRERVEFERNTVWRDMIGLERKHSAIGLRGPSPQADSVEYSLMEDEMNGMSRLTPTTRMAREGRTRFLGAVLPQWLGRQLIFALLSIAMFGLIIRSSGILPVQSERYCAALLVFVSMLWATEVMPLFATSLLVPFLVVILGVLCDPITLLPLPANLAARRIFAAMFSPAIMLLLGGFAIAAALTKHMIAKELSARVLSLAGSGPRQLLLACMIVATVLSMWISNVAAPVLCFSLIHPILRTLPPDSSFAKCLILGIALASNIGGMASPIASPQNLIAMAVMQPPPSWVEWFAVAIPLALACDLAAWALLIWHYKPPNQAAIHRIRPSSDPIRGVQIYVVIVTALTVALWCLESTIHAVVGDMAIIAIIPLVAFFGIGVLTKEDFNNFLWTVIILAQGGIALGEAVSSSGLLHRIATTIQSMVIHHHVWMVLFIFCGLVMVIATFISHTVAAVILLPVIEEVGRVLPDPHPRLLVMGATLMCSCAMGLPVSGFPNMTAIMLEDGTGVRYLTTGAFVKTGVPASVVSFLLIVTMGYAIMVSIGF